MDWDAKAKIAAVAAFIALLSLIANIVQGIINYKFSRENAALGDLKDIVRNLATRLEEGLVFQIRSRQDEIWEHVFTSLSILNGNTSAAYIAVRHSSYASGQMAMSIIALNAHVKRMLVLRASYAKHKASLPPPPGQELDLYAVQNSWSDYGNAETLRTQGIQIANRCSQEISNFLRNT